MLKKLSSMKIFQYLRQGLANGLDILQRFLSNNSQYRHWSRSQLISYLEEVTNIHETAQENLARELMQLLDDVEGVARGDLSIRANAEADVTGAIADSFNFFLDDLCKLIAELPSDSPLRQKYRIPRN